MPPKCPKCQTYHSQKKPCPADLAQSAPSAEPFLETLGVYTKAKLLTQQNPDAYIFITELLDRYAALRTAQLREKTIQECIKIADELRDKASDEVYEFRKDGLSLAAFSQEQVFAFKEIGKRLRALLTVAAQTPQQVKNPGRSMGDAK